MKLYTFDKYVGKNYSPFSLYIKLKTKGISVQVGIQMARQNPLIKFN